MSLSPEKFKQLKQKAHVLEPVVLLGAKGLTDAVQKEIDMALNTHELIKVRLNAPDHESRDAMIKTICEVQHAELIVQIGKIIAIYRKREEKK
ncbi:MAG: YhbY family RNA-binding protein [Gammaproteobacteria bacterium]|jgi:RNA-binding protein